MKIIQIIKGGSHISVWIWKLLVTIDYWKSPYRPKGAKLISLDWNPD